MNQVNLMGRIVRDVELRYGQTNNMPVARFSIACSKKFKKEGQPTSDFIECVAFSKLAELISKSFHKGSQIFVTGEWTSGSYINKEGVKVYTNVCTVTGIEFIDKKSADNSDNNASKGGGIEVPSADGFMNIPDGIDEELPFM